MPTAKAFCAVPSAQTKKKKKGQAAAWLQASGAFSGKTKQVQGLHFLEDQLPLFLHCIRNTLY